MAREEPVFWSSSRQRRTVEPRRRRRVRGRESDEDDSDTDLIACGTIELRVHALDDVNIPEAFLGSTRGHARLTRAKRLRPHVCAVCSPDVPGDSAAVANRTTPVSSVTVDPSGKTFDAHWPPLATSGARGNEIRLEFDALTLGVQLRVEDAAGGGTLARGDIDIASLLRRHRAPDGRRRTVVLIDPAGRASGRADVWVACSVTARGAEAKERARASARRRLQPQPRATQPAAPTREEQDRAPQRPRSRPRTPLSPFAQRQSQPGSQPEARREAPQFSAPLTGGGARWAAGRRSTARFTGAAGTAAQASAAAEHSDTGNSSEWEAEAKRTPPPSPRSPPPPPPRPPRRSASPSHAVAAAVAAAQAAAAADSGTDTDTASDLGSDGGFGASVAVSDRPHHAKPAPSATHGAEMHQSDAGDWWKSGGGGGDAAPPARPASATAGGRGTGGRRRGRKESDRQWALRTGQALTGPLAMSRDETASTSSALRVLRRAAEEDAREARQFAAQQRADAARMRRLYARAEAEREAQQRARAEVESALLEMQALDMVAYDRKHVRVRRARERARVKKIARPYLRFQRRIKGPYFGEGPPVAAPWSPPRAESRVAWDMHGRRHAVDDASGQAEADDPTSRVIAHVRRLAAARTGYDLRRPFARWDADGSGSLTGEEFRKGLAALGVDVRGEELAHVVRAFDTNGDGSVDYGEFLFVFFNRRRLRASWEERVRALASAGGDAAAAVRRNLRARGLAHTAPAVGDAASGGELARALLRGLDPEGTGLAPRRRVRRMLDRIGVTGPEWELQTLLDRFAARAETGPGARRGGLPPGVDYEALVDFLEEEEEEDGEEDASREPAGGTAGAFVGERPGEGFDGGEAASVTALGSTTRRAEEAAGVLDAALGRQRAMERRLRVQRRG